MIVTRHSSTVVEVPVLETARLRLRGHREEDFADCCAMWADPIVTRHIGGNPFPAENVWSKLLRYVGHWALLGYGYWVIEERETGRFAGEAGFADFKRDITPSFDGMPEIGWALSAWAHGRGFATESVRAMVAWADGQFGDTPTVCMIDPENAPSIRVALKCGYREFDRTTYKGEPTILFRRPQT